MTCGIAPHRTGDVSYKILRPCLGEYGITVNSIALGIATTEMAKNHPDMTDNIPSGRVADPSEVANVILFLASDEGQYITGATLDVNGGIRMA